MRKCSCNIKHFKVVCVHVCVYDSAYVHAYIGVPNSRNIYVCVYNASVSN
jgi:hypothetical protein